MTDSNGKPAVVLLSGGLDSTTCLAIAKDLGFKLHALSFRYGQRHEYELDRAKDIAKHFSVMSHQIVDINLGQCGGSALTDRLIDVPESDHVEDIDSDLSLIHI